MKIGLLSDTHSFIDNDILKYLKPCDEIWHAGDVGEITVVNKIADIKSVKGVFGNIDGAEIRSIWTKDLIWSIEGKKIWMTHIGGYPPNYLPDIRKKMDEIKPDIFVCGHSHILKIIPDKNRNLLHLNPGAAGHHGFHLMRTMIRFDLKDNVISSMEVIELGKRGKIKP